MVVVYPLTLRSFFLVLFPPFLCYYITALLVLLPHTLVLRVALLPLSLYLTFRCVTQPDLSLGHDSNRLGFLNQSLAVRDVVKSRPRQFLTFS